MADKKKSGKKKEVEAEFDIDPVIITEELWSCSVIVVVNNSDPGLSGQPPLVELLLTEMRNRPRKRFRQVTYEDVVKLVFESGGNKMKKGDKDSKIGQSLLEACKVYTSKKDIIPCNLLARLFKLFVYNIKMDEIGLPEMDIAESADKIAPPRLVGETSKKKGEDKAKKNEKPATANVSKGKKAPNAGKTKETENLFRLGAESDSKWMKKRGYEEEPDFENDEPIDGPDLYIILHHFPNWEFLKDLYDIFPFDAIFALESNLEQIQLRNNMNSSQFLRPIVRRYNGSDIQVFNDLTISENYGPSLFTLPPRKPSDDYNKLVQLLNHCPDRQLHPDILMFTMYHRPRPLPVEVSKSKEISTPGKSLIDNELRGRKLTGTEDLGPSKDRPLDGPSLWDKVAFLAYDLQKFRKEYQHYRKKLKLLPFPLESDSRHHVRTTSEMTTYHTLMARIPEECMSVPLVLDALMAQVEADVAPKPTKTKERLSLSGSVDETRAMSEELRAQFEALEVKYFSDSKETKTKEVRTKVTEYGDDVSQVTAHVDSPNFLSPEEMRQQTQEMLKHLVNAMVILRKEGMSPKERGERYGLRCEFNKKLMELAKMPINEVNRILLTLTFEWLPHYIADERGQISLVHQQPVIWDYPYSLADYYVKQGMWGCLSSPLDISQRSKLSLIRCECEYCLGTFTTTLSREDPLEVSDSLPNVQGDQHALWGAPGVMEERGTEDKNKAIQAGPSAVWKRQLDDKQFTSGYPYYITPIPRVPDFNKGSATTLPMTDGGRFHYSDWHFTEALTAAVFQQVLHRSLEDLPFIYVYPRLDEDAILVVLQNPSNKHLYNRKEFNYLVHSNVGIREYHDRFSPVMGAEVKDVPGQSESYYSIGTSQTQSPAKKESIQIKEPTKKTLLLEGSIKDTILSKQEAPEIKIDVETVELPRKDQKLSDDPSGSKVSNHKKSKRKSKDMDAGDLKQPSKSELPTSPDSGHSFLGYDVMKPVIHLSETCMHFFTQDSSRVRLNRYLFTGRDPCCHITVSSGSALFCLSQIGSGVTSNSMKVDDSSFSHSNGVDSEEILKVIKTTPLFADMHGNYEVLSRKIVFSGELPGGVRFSVYKKKLPTPRFRKNNRSDDDSGVEVKESSSRSREIKKKDKGSKERSEDVKTPNQRKKKGGSSKTDMKVTEETSDERVRRLREECFIHLTLSLPSGLIVEILREDDDPMRYLVKQFYLTNNSSVWPEGHPETCRYYSGTGDLTIFRQNNELQVLGNTGLDIRCKGLALKPQVQKPPGRQSMSRVQRSKSKAQIHKIKSDFIAPQPSDVAVTFASYSVTDSDGHRFIIGEDNMRWEVPTLWANVAIDYSTEEIYALREDGMAQVHRKDGTLIVHWEDGTRFTSWPVAYSLPASVSAKAGKTMKQNGGRQVVQMEETRKDSQRNSVTMVIKQPPEQAPSLETGEDPMGDPIEAPGPHMVDNERGTRVRMEHPKYATVSMYDSGQKAVVTLPLGITVTAEAHEVYHIDLLDSTIEILSEGLKVTPKNKDRAPLTLHMAYPEEGNISCRVQDQMGNCMYLKDDQPVIELDKKVSRDRSSLEADMDDYSPLNSDTDVNDAFFRSFNDKNTETHFKGPFFSDKETLVQKGTHSYNSFENSVGSDSRRSSRGSLGMHAMPHTPVHRPRFFIVSLDGNAVELLGGTEMEDFLAKCMNDPGVGVHKENVADNLRLEHYTIMLPSYNSNRNKWTWSYHEPSIEPPGLDCQNLKFMKPKVFQERISQLKSMHSGYIKQMAENLIRRESETKSPDIPITPPCLELRHLLKWEEITDVVRLAFDHAITRFNIDKRRRNYVSQFIKKEATSPMESVLDHLDVKARAELIEKSLLDRYKELVHPGNIMQAKRACERVTLPMAEEAVGTVDDQDGLECLQMMGRPVFVKTETGKLTHVLQDKTKDVSTSTTAILETRVFPRHTASKVQNDLCVIPKSIDFGEVIPKKGYIYFIDVKNQKLESVRFKVFPPAIWTGLQVSQSTNMIAAGLSGQIELKLDAERIEIPLGDTLEYTLEILTERCVIHVPVRARLVLEGH